MTKKERFLSCLVGAAELVGKELSPQAMKLYWEILKKYEIEEIETGFMTHASNPDAGQFMPKPADIIKAIEGSGESNALQAWTKVDQAIRLVGPYQSVVFDDPIIHAVLQDMGGWINFGNFTNDELPFKCNEFNKRYSGYAQRTKLGHPKKLTGIMEMENTNAGQPVEAPILLGEPEKAKLVFESGGAGKLGMTKASNLLEQINEDVAKEQESV